MNQSIWMIIIGIILLGNELKCLKENDIKNIEYNVKTGLLYEEITPFHIISDTWEILITLDNINCKNALKTFSEMLEKALIHCKESAQFRCHERIQHARLKNKIEMAVNIRSRLLEEVNELNSKSTITHESLNNLRKKRQLLNNNNNVTIVEFNSNLIEENFDNYTNTIKAELENFNQLEPQILTELKLLKDHLNNPLNNSKELDELMYYQKLNLILNEASLSLEKSIEEYIKYLEAMLIVVHSIQQGKIHSYLLKKKQLLNIINKVEKLNKNLQFPMTIDEINIPDIIRISSMSYKIVDNDKLHVTLEIPLSKKTKYILYRMHPIYRKQEILNNGTGYAYIKPNTQFIAIDEHKKYYFPLKKNILKNCHKIAGRYYCYLIEAHYSVTELMNCDVELLNAISMDIFKKCNIRISFNYKPSWMAIESLGGWLYSLPNEETTEILCDNKDPKYIKLRNTGFLKLSSKCVLRTKTVTLYPMKTTIINSKFNNFSPIELNLSEISSILFNYYNNKKLQISSCPNNKNDCSLLELETYLMTDNICETNEFYYFIFIILGILIILLIIIIFIIIFMCIFYSRYSRQLIRKESNESVESDCEERTTRKYLPQRTLV